VSNPKLRLVTDRPLSPDEWLEREMRSLLASWKAAGGQGPYASRSIANVAQGVQCPPHRIIARRMREARAKRVRYELVRQLGELLITYAALLYRRPAEDAGTLEPEPTPVALRRAA
jgi:hypothetical protein